MNGTSNASESKLKKFFGTLGPKQILGLVLAFVFAFVLTVMGWSSNCFVFFIIGLALYMIPHLLGVDNIKLLTVFGIIFMVVVILVGANAIVPGMIDNKSTEPSDNDYFSDINYTYTVNDEGESGVLISATVSNIGSNDVLFQYTTINYISFEVINFDKNYKETKLEVTGNTASGFVVLDSNQLYYALLILGTTSDGSTTYVSASATSSTILKEAYSGDMSGFYYYGCVIQTIYIMIIFFMILYLSAFMRSRFEKTREKLEAQGRLYPQGYGRCDKCGALVLPGEVTCRKCGAYIDRPEEIKPKKKDFFECSDCGAEVPADAKECPKCGAKFDEEEILVEHADGTIDVTKDTFECSECGSIVPVTATFCPKCGAKFDEDTDTTKKTQ
ncbi:MAG: zinc-ribbon domain-containing protein [Candidatus Methanomethylophilaceae archaeon]|nr:zinc-ribbon domain-containing protein [Candidatus Methanomethylophilaceae archaeon]